MQIDQLRSQLEVSACRYCNINFFWWWFSMAVVCDVCHWHSSCMQCEFILAKTCWLQWHYRKDVVGHFAQSGNSVKNVGSTDSYVDLVFTKARSVIILIIMIRFLTRQVPVTQVLRHGGRYATSQPGLIVKRNVKQMCLWSWLESGLLRATVEECLSCLRI